MSRILAYTAPSRGQLFPMVPILEELRERGHEIALRTLASELATMRSLGFEATPIDPRVEAIAMDDWRARTPPGVALRAGRVLGRRAPLDAADLAAAIADAKPDALLVDTLAWGALDAAEGWGGPWAATCPFPLPLRSRFGPPMGPGLRPATGPLGRCRDAAIRAGTGVMSRGGDELLLAAPLVLYLSAEPFEYPRPDWPASVFMAGPCPWEPPGEPPAELARIDAPLVLLTTSTEFQDDGRLVVAAFEALADEPLHMLATVPTAGTAGLRPPANATLVEFAPHGPILDRAVCAITHGGMGTTQKALARGVPVCAVPFGRDQYEVARRVEVNGAGTTLPSYLLRPGRLRRAVRTAIASREGAARLASAFAAAPGPGGAADAFEQRLLRRSASA